MKITRPIVLAIAAVAVLTGTGVAAAMSDVQIIPAGPRVIRQFTKPPVSEEPTTETTAETSSSATPENDTDNVSSPVINTQKQTIESEVTQNETPAPTPEVEYDPTPEPLPAPDTNITNVENTNNVLGNNTPGNVSHN